MDTYFNSDVDSFLQRLQQFTNVTDLDVWDTANGVESISESEKT